MDSQVAVFLVVVLVHCVSDGGVLSFNLEPTLPVIKRGEPSSYFGFSVAQHSTSNGSSWILVGAPLGQNLQPQTNRSGALFKCPISSYEADCVQVVTDGKRDSISDYDDPSVNSEQLSAPVASEQKDGQWLGVNVRSQGPGQKVVVCAHRYIHQGKDFKWGIGLCHFLKNDFEYDTTLQPCRNKQRHAFEDYGFCQAGTSAAILEDSTALLGAPGAFTARGMLFGISVSEDYINKDRNQYKTPVEYQSREHKYEYLGMSVTGGKFFGDKISFVSGAPKAANFSGQVIFFSKGLNEILEVSATLTGPVRADNGEGFASSYGYELATLDLNGDK
ncbi:unnamed protein product [Allacma fusca]|uniref:Uncharacterized protein n=1 Tax=Allacma fusca TaxID=39272 RepID=A0A8J2JK43_9HEXA|nr:unnamed protein product [Allacma fusca]